MQTICRHSVNSVIFIGHWSRILEFPVTLWRYLNLLTSSVKFWRLQIALIRGRVCPRNPVKGCLHDLVCSRLVGHQKSDVYSTDRIGLYTPTVYKCRRNTAVTNLLQPRGLRMDVTFTVSCHNRLERSLAMPWILTNSFRSYVDIFWHLFLTLDCTGKRR